MKETSQKLTRIKICGYVENFLNQKVWYESIIRLDKKYLLEDLRAFSQMMNAHYPTITICEIEK